MFLCTPNEGIIIGHRPIGERMTERKRNPEEILEEMINKNVKFQFLEIASGVAAAGGTIALVAAKNTASFAAVAAFPLTLSIALNYFNRRRLDQLTRQQTLLDITEVQRRLSSEIQGIRGQAPSYSAGDMDAASAGQFENAIASLSETVAGLELRMQQGTVGSADTSHLDSELVQLRNHQLDLSQSLEAVNQQLRAQPVSADSSHLEAEIAELRQHLAQVQSAQPMSADSSHLEAEIAELKQHIAQLQTMGASVALGAVGSEVDLNSLRNEFQDQLHPVHKHLSDLESRLAEVNQSPEPSAPVDVEPLRAELMQIVAPVQQQMLSLEERLAAQPAAVTSQVAPEEIQSVHSNVSALNDKLENIAAQLSAEIAGFQQFVESTQSHLQTVQQQVQASQQDVPAPAAVLDAGAIHQEMQAVIGPLHEQLAALEHKVSNAPQPDASVSQVQSEQMISLQNQLNNMNGLIEEVANQFTSELTKVNSELSKVPQLVEKHVDHKVSNLQPVASQDPKKDSLSELDAILADINL
jgi:predicted  nucleic acid-binding Zn-ribbon protein